MVRPRNHATGENPFNRIQVFYVFEKMSNFCFKIILLLGFYWRLFWWNRSATIFVRQKKTKVSHDILFTWMEFFSNRNFSRQHFSTSTRQKPFLWSSWESMQKIEPAYFLSFLKLLGYLKTNIKIYIWYWYKHRTHKRRTEKRSDSTNFGLSNV